MTDVDAAVAAAVKKERERCAMIAESHRVGEVLIMRKMSEVDQVGVVSMTIAAAIRGEERSVVINGKRMTTTVK